MRIITYFGFTLLSILIQFCVMDYIQERLHQDKGTLDLNLTKPKTKDIKDISYSDSNQLRRVRKAYIELKKSVYGNTSDLIQPRHSTELTSTILDIFYDDNISTTDYSFTTDFVTSTEIDNVTEINFPLNIKPVTPKPEIKQKSINEDCNCNLLYEVCDINCCCDSDCSEEQQNLFHCNNITNKSTEQDGVCYSYLFHNEKYSNNIIDNMFCIVKVNLPEKRKVSHKKYQESLPHQYFTWRNYDSMRSELKFTKDIYKIGDPVWLLNNGSMFHLDLPCPLINNYCSKRKRVSFFKDEEIQCIVKLKDLEMFHIYNLAEQTKIISATNTSSVNSSSLNCSTLHCANWTILVCNDLACEYYNKSLHEPSCTETLCTNLALIVDYIFYTHETKIVNASVKLHVRKISIALPHMLQKIKVNFLLTNTSIDEIVKFSGNPGYQKGLRVIISQAQSNYTDNFINSRIESDKYFSLPVKKNGQCLFPNITDNFIIFGTNKRLKCRYVHKNYRTKNYKEACKDMYDNVHKFLLLNNTIGVSAYGNPRSNEWILLNFNNPPQESVYGKVDSEPFKIFCYNLITKITLSFAFTNLNGEGNKILSVKHQVIVSNKSFTLEDMSTVITIDISFIDVTKPAVFEYASSPDLHINLPKDFFFPSNIADFQCSNVLLILFYCCIIIFK